MKPFSRRYLPPMHVLAAFEAAARHQSFTAAASELSLTQSAVSRQIRMLEGILGSELFVRVRQTVRLTAAGEAYAHEVRATLQRISAATLGFRANPRGGSLNLAILPTFGARWLAPRLPRFIAAHPGVSVNLTTRLAPFDFQADPVDAAIHFGPADWPGARLEFLMNETLVPTCNPALFEQFAFREPADLIKAPLVHIVSRPDAWERWLRAKSVDCVGMRGMLVDQLAVATQAAISGLGVALLPTYLIEAELARGDLRIAIAESVESPDGYYLAWPSNREQYAPLRLFRTWLIDEARLQCKREVPGGYAHSFIAHRFNSSTSLTVVE